MPIRIGSVDPAASADAAADAAADEAAGASDAAELSLLLLEPQALSTRPATATDATRAPARIRRLGRPNA